jgi:hypothetical protein
VTTDSDDTAVQASIEDAGDAGTRADAQVRVVLGRVMAQRRSAETALDYVRELAPGVKANCWGLAEAAGHENPYRMQALLRSYRWDWKDLRAELSALARAWLPCDPGDLIGPGIAVDETAQLKDGDATACVAPQHAGCTGHVENCVTTVFSAWVTTSGNAESPGRRTFLGETPSTGRLRAFPAMSACIRVSACKPAMRRMTGSGLLRKLQCNRNSNG